MRITVPMYEKGRSFVLAAGLLKAYYDHKFVYLHLICQGFENIGKALLLTADYDKYEPLLRPHYHHHLDRLLPDVNAVQGREFFTSDAARELLDLNKFYRRQQFRYGAATDFSSSISTLSADHLHIELVSHLDRLNYQFALRQRDEHSAAG